MGPGVGPGLGASLSSLGAPVSPSLYVFVSSAALCTPAFWGFVEASLPRHGWLSPWPLVNDSNLQPLSLPQRSGGGTEITWLVPLVTPSSGVFQKSFINIIQNILIILNTWEIPRVWGALCQKRRWRSPYTSYDKSQQSQQVFEKVRYTPILEASAIRWFFRNVWIYIQPLNRPSQLLACSFKIQLSC